MEEVKVCRICINMDVKLHDLRSYPLESYYESVIGTNPLFINLPPYACYECAALVRKFYFFRQKILRSQAILCGITDNFGKLTSRDVLGIDRYSLGIASHIEANVPEVYGISSLDTKNIKDEPTNTEYGVEDGFKLEEDSDYDNLPSVSHGLSSDDDEPLSHHKEKKSKSNVESVDEKIDLKEEFDGLQFAVGSNDETSGNIIKVPSVVEKKKKDRPKNAPQIKREKMRERKVPRIATRSALCGIEQDVTVITLTLEEQIEEVNKRKESSNYLNSTYQCNLCFKGFIDDEAWKHHVSKHSPNAGSVECQVCKFRFKNKRTLQKHASNHEKRYACKLCPYICTNTTQAKQHQGWHKGITFKCKYCDEIFTIWTSYMSHVRIKHPSEFICGVCGYSFISKLGLSMHKSMMHKDVQENDEDSKEGGPYCAECDVKFISTEAYKRHMVMSVKHTQGTDSIKGCRTCGATFENTEELLQHRKEHTRKRPKNYGKKPSNTAWPAKCEHCPEEIPNAREYWNHFRRVHPDKNYPIQKNYVCDICGKSFRGNAFLVYHKRTHSEERAFKCTQCDKAFFNRTNLQVHAKTHSDNRPHACTVCFKAFKCKAALNRHFRVHEGTDLSEIRPFPCSACSKTFKTKGAVTRHFVSHTGQKPYECEVCGKGFSQSNSRKLHVRTVHLKQPAPYISRSRLERRKQAPKELPTQQFIY